MKATLPVLAVGLWLVAACPSSGGARAPEPPAADPPSAPAAEASAEASASGDTASAAAPGGEVTRDGDELIVPGAITFDVGSSDLAGDSEAALAALRGFLASHEDITMVRIEGHVSGAAGVKNEVELTGERAYSVGRWLRDQGIACERLLAAAFGSSKPVADDSTPEGHARNTRITVRVAALRGKPIGGMPLDGGAVAAVNVCPE